MNVFWERHGGGHIGWTMRYSLLGCRCEYALSEYVDHGSLLYKQLRPLMDMRRWTVLHTQRHKCVK